MCKFICSSLDTPENILKVTNLKYIHSLCQSSQVLSISPFSSFTQLVLVSCNELIKILSSVDRIDPEVLWSARSKCVEQIDHRVTTFFRFCTLWEELLLPVNHRLSNLHIKILVIFLPESLNNVGKVECCTFIN